MNFILSTIFKGCFHKNLFAQTKEIRMGKPYVTVRSVKDMSIIFREKKRK